MRFPPGAATRILSLSTSPRTSEGLSVQYDMTPPRLGTRTVAGDSAKVVQKWKIHFAKPPKSSTLAALAKSVTTEVLVRNLELGEETVRLSSFSFVFYLHLIFMRMWDCTTTEAFHRCVRSRNSGLVERSLILLLTVYLRSLQVHSGYTLAIHHPDLHFCMTPYCSNPLKRYTSWSGVRQRLSINLKCTSRLPRRNMLSYIHSCMHRGRCVIPYLFTVRKAAGRDDVLVSPKQNIWYYLGERRWSLADIKTLWDSLGAVLAYSFPCPRRRLTLLRVS
jgi:hypothetical protein